MEPSSNRLVWCETWKSVGKSLGIQTALFPDIHSDQVNIVSIIQLSFIKKSTDKNKTVACFCGSSFHYYFHASNFKTRIVLAMQKRSFRKGTVWTLIVHNCWKTLPPRKTFRPSFSFLFGKVIEKRFLGFFPLLLHFPVNTLSKVQWKITEKLKSAENWNIFWRDFYSCLCKCKHHFLNFIIRLLWSFARTGLWTRVG